MVHADDSFRGGSVYGEFTVEGWIKLDGGIGNRDGLVRSDFSVDTQDLNFAGGRFRLYSPAGPGSVDNIIAATPAVAGVWTDLDPEIRTGVL